jgi:hypothetical protein
LFSVPAFEAPFLGCLLSLEMQCDAVEGDHEADGGEDDGRDPAGLFPDSLFGSVSVLISAFGG